ncbi:MAG TPA: hypothetical protein VHB99_10705, partial [Pirellulales bacterium]|nr:hypothetical protein [Pirellulales bacterium]
MDSAEQPPRERDWLAFVLPVLGFCVVDCLAAVGIVQSGAELTWGFLFGAFRGQMLWGAAWCALGAGRWIHRFVAVVAAGVLVAGVMLAGVYSQNETPPEHEPVYDRSGGMNVRIIRFGPAALTPRPRETARNRVLMGVSGLPLFLLIAQCPLLGLRILRGWHIAFRGAGSEAPTSAPRNFSIADLFAATAAAAIVLGFWRLQLRVGADEIVGGLAFLAGWSGFAFIGGMLALLIVPLALGERGRRLALALLLACIVLLGVVMPL